MFWTHTFGSTVALSRASGSVFASVCAPGPIVPPMADSWLVVPSSIVYHKKREGIEEKRALDGLLGTKGVEEGGNDVPYRTISSGDG